MAQAPKQPWTKPELERARVLAFDVRLPAGSIAKLLTHEFGTERKPEGVRDALRKYFGWQGVPRGKPSALRNCRANAVQSGV